MNRPRPNLNQPNRDPSFEEEMLLIYERLNILNILDILNVLETDHASVILEICLEMIETLQIILEQYV